MTGGTIREKQEDGDLIGEGLLDLANGDECCGSTADETGVDGREDQGTGSVDRCLAILVPAEVSEVSDPES